MKRPAAVRSEARASSPPNASIGQVPRHGRHNWRRRRFLASAAVGFRNAVTRLLRPVLMVRLSAMLVPEKISMRVESSPMSAKAKCSHGEDSQPEANRFCA